MTTIQCFYHRFDSAGERVRVADRTAVNLLEQVVLATVFDASRAELHLRSSITHHAITVSIVSDCLIMRILSKEDGSVVVRIDFLTLVYKAAVETPYFALFGYVLQLFAAALVALCQFLLFSCLVIFHLNKLPSCCGFVSGFRRCYGPSARGEMNITAGFCRPTYLYGKAQYLKLSVIMSIFHGTRMLHVWEPRLLFTSTVYKESKKTSQNRPKTDFP